MKTALFRSDRTQRRPMDLGTGMTVATGPHPFERMGWRWWLCRHCFAPRSLHPRRDWVKARSVRDHRYISADAPHFKEGW